MTRLNTHTNTYTDSQRERERERERPWLKRRKYELSVIERAAETEIQRSSSTENPRENALAIMVVYILWVQWAGFTQ